jgi:hypothetical protein
LVDLFGFEIDIEYHGYVTRTPDSVDQWSLGMFCQRCHRCRTSYQLTDMLAVTMCKQYMILVAVLKLDLLAQFPVSTRSRHCTGPYTCDSRHDLPLHQYQSPLLHEAPRYFTKLPFLMWLACRHGLWWYDVVDQTIQESRPARRSHMHGYSFSRRPRAQYGSPLVASIVQVSVKTCGTLQMDHIDPLLWPGS